MGNRLTDELKAAGTLQFWFEYVSGSLLNRGLGALPAPTLSGTPIWRRTKKGIAVAGGANAGGMGGLDYGVAASCDFTTAGAIWCVYNTIVLPVSGYQVVMSKQNWGAGLNGYSIYLDAVFNRFSLSDGVGDQTINVSRAGMAGVGAPMFLGLSWGGGQRSEYINGAKVSSEALTHVPAPAGMDLVMCSDLSKNYTSYGGILYAGGNNTQLTDAQMARLFDEFINSPMQSADLPRRNFVYIDKGKADWEYAAAGIVLDTKFESIMVGGTRKIADDSPSNY